MHPEDAKALQMLRKIKGFDELIRASMEYGYEQVFRGENMGFMVKVNSRNFPELYHLIYFMFYISFYISLYFFLFFLSEI